MRKAKEIRKCFLTNDMSALPVAVQITHSHIHKLRNKELSNNIPVDTTTKCKGVIGALELGGKGLSDT